MAVDLGGTNFRVCSVQLHGDTTFTLIQSKVAIPQELMVASTAHELFSFLALQIEKFLKEHHTERYHGHVIRRRRRREEEEQRQQQQKEVENPDANELDKAQVLEESEEVNLFSMGFTFSFPVQQRSINKGNLIRWTKGFDIADAVGKDVCALLQTEIDALHLPVKVAALVNDTVGTLLARSYTSPGKSGTLLGGIFGTGTNGAYVERLDRIPKLAADRNIQIKSNGKMIINTEWGSFDNDLKVLPRTSYDDALDHESNNPGLQMFEKRVSGMFLGEILRRALLRLQRTDQADKSAALFSDATSAENDLHSTTTVAPDSALFRRWGLDTSFLSLAHADHSLGLRIIRQTLENTYSVSAPSEEDAQAVKTVASAVGLRAARLAAVAIGAVIIATGHGSSSTAKSKKGRAPGEDMIDIGVDGSLVEFYPGFEESIRQGLREIKDIGPEVESRVEIGIAKDGSGVGAALSALVVEEVERS